VEFHRKDARYAEEAPRNNVSATNDQPLGLTKCLIYSDLQIVMPKTASLLLILILVAPLALCQESNKQELAAQVKREFLHAWNGYIEINPTLMREWDLRQWRAAQEDNRRASLSSERAAQRPRR
jgi:hypothetical protein